MRWVVLPSGLVTPARAAAEPPETKVDAPVYPSPGRRIIWEVAPAPRIAVTAAWTEPAQEFKRPAVFTTMFISLHPNDSLGVVRTVVRLIHQAHDHLRLSGVLLGQLRP